MITASHNAAEFNGFKILLGETTIYGEEIQELRRKAEMENSYPVQPAVSLKWM